MKKLISILIFFLFCGNLNVFAQEELKIVVQDSIQDNEINPLAPAKAAFFSAILPGLGQAYNKKYWKIPIVYIALGSGVAIYADNNKKYHMYRDEYKKRLNGTNDESENNRLSNFTEAQLVSAQKQFQKNRDISMIVTVGLYILNIVDANVDAHLLQFNVSDKLTFRPEVYQNDLNYKQNVGVSVNYNF